jgi:hypothetical protein
LGDTSIAEGAPGNPGLKPLNTSSYPYQGAWFNFHQESPIWALNTRLPPPPGPEAVLALTKSLVLQSDQGSNTSTILDFAGLQNMFKLPSAANNTSNTSTTNPPPVTLTFSDLTLINMPPGPYSSYPAGLLTMLMWNVDMDRWVQSSSRFPGINGWWVGV